MMNENNNRLTSAGRRLPVLLAIFALLLTAVIFLPVQAQDRPDAPASAGAVASDPDFSKIDDPLNGEYELYTVDDLVIGRTKPANNNTASDVLNYILETENESISSQSVLGADYPECWLTSGRQPQRTRIGRFFALPYDVIVTLLPYGTTASGSDCSAPAGQPNMALHVQSTNFADNQPNPFTMSAAQTAVAMDDFNQDGFEDLFIMSDQELLVASARDVNDWTEGMRFGPATSISPALAARSDPATGDFNNDGYIDVAWIDSGFNVQLATVCPDTLPGTVCADSSALGIVLNPGQAGSTNISVSNATGNCLYDDVGDVALTAGDYTGNGSAGLVTVGLVQYGTGVEDCDYYASWYEFEPDFLLDGGTFKGQLKLDYDNPNLNAFNVYAESAALDWLGGSDQAVIAAGAVGDGNYTEIVSALSFAGGSIAQQSKLTTAGDCPFPHYVCPWINGLALGHYEDVSDSQSTDTNFNLQIATLRNDGVVTIYSVDPQTEFTPAVVSQTTLESGLGLEPRTTNTSGFTWLVAGDLQGRSARLGPPSVVRVTSHSQPSVILGAPPMHVDYILPDVHTASEWQVVNFSAVPDAYNSSYKMSQTTSNQSSDTNTTSYTYATAQESGAKVSLKIPYLPSISGAIKKTTEDKNEDVSEANTFTQDEFTYNASTTTGFGDEIWYDQSSFNVYYYPVLGETVCPATLPDCSAGDEQPLYVTFSGPDSSGTGPAPGANTEWYQPVHEPGNIFSYPWNETQLANRIGPGIQLLSSSLSFFTDDSTQTQLVEWSSGSGQDQTTGTTNTHSYEKSYSMTAGKSFGKILGVEVEGNLDYNNSTSIGTLNKSTSSVGASQGIAINKPGTFLTYQEYQYNVQPYIFGRMPPAGQVDSVSLNTDNQTTGPLQAAFAADPLDSNAGSWWGSDSSPYTQAIDVALNHPSRWTKTANFGQDTLNCLNQGQDCMVFNDPTPDDLWNSEFYWMRGLLVTVGGDDGPQRQQATAGEDVFLEARVYNYSLKDMDADSSIHVRFYRQEISGTTPVGDSVLILPEQVMNPLPGFNSPNSPDTANWNSIKTTLDTTDLGDTYQFFWVVVWVEDSSGEMVPELQGHGLSAKPGTLTSIGDVPLEMVTLDGDQKTFSNNVGFLHSKFYIADATTGLPLPDADTQLEIVGATVTPAAAQPGERVIVSALVAAKEAPADSVHVTFYPDAAAWYAYQDSPTLTAPRPFDVEMLPFIDVGTADRLEVPYSSSTCGKQTILIAAQSGAQGDTTTATASFDNGPCLAYSPVLPVQAPK